MKRKLERFAELSTFKHVIQPRLSEVLNKDYILKNKWNKDFFLNDNPIIIELGCGKGEYTIGLAKKYKNRNFIGIDIKGARIWRGAKTINEEGIKNAGFLRSRIEFIDSFFGENEISEIWLTFSDPQLKKPRKRLTSPLFLNKYKNFLTKDGIIHLKTDNSELYEYTLNLAHFNNLPVISFSDDLYNTSYIFEAKMFQTFYESKFLDEGIKIKYLSFKLNENKIEDLPDGR